MKELNHLAVIDYQPGNNLAGNKKEFAQDLLDLLAKQLPQDFKAINQAFSKKNYVVLQQLVHRLHGALSYCGVPRLKTLVNQLETNLKKNILNDLSALMAQLENEVKLFLETYATYEYQTYQK